MSEVVLTPEILTSTRGVPVAARPHLFGLWLAGP